jgi:hypothetical protein
MGVFSLITEFLDKFFKKGEEPGDGRVAVLGSPSAPAGQS